MVEAKKEIFVNLSNVFPYYYSPPVYFILYYNKNFHKNQAGIFLVFFNIIPKILVKVKKRLSAVVHLTNVVCRAPMNAENGRIC